MCLVHIESREHVLTAFVSDQVSSMVGNYVYLLMGWTPHCLPPSFLPPTTCFWSTTATCWQNAHFWQCYCNSSYRGELWPEVFKDLAEEKLTKKTLKIGRVTISQHVSVMVWGLLWGTLDQWKLVLPSWRHGGKESEWAEEVPWVWGNLAL